MAWHHLDLADFLLVAEAVLAIPAEDLAAAARLDLADSALHAPGADFGGTDFYSTRAAKTVVLASRMIRNHPLPEGNNGSGTCGRSAGTPSAAGAASGYPSLLASRQPMMATMSSQKSRSTVSLRPVLPFTIPRSSRNSSSLGSSGVPPWSIRTW